MLTWIRNNPYQTTANVSGLLFLIFIILAIISYFKVSDAKKTGKEASKEWVRINTASYVLLAIIAFIFMVYACSQSSFSCLAFFLLFGSR
jgi:L-asparagine transporter-like permease